MSPRTWDLVKMGLELLIGLIILDIITRPAHERAATGWHTLMTTAGHIARTAGQISMWAELNYRKTVSP